MQHVATKTTDGHATELNWDRIVAEFSASDGFESLTALALQKRAAGVQVRTFLDECVTVFEAGRVSEQLNKVFDLSRTGSGDLNQVEIETAMNALKQGATLAAAFREATAGRTADQAILAVAREWQDLEDQIEELEDRLAETSSARPLMPDVLRYRSDDWFRTPHRDPIGAPLREWTIQAYREAPTKEYGLTEDLLAKLLARSREITDAHDAWTAEQRALRASSGFDIFEERQAALMKRQDEVEQSSVLYRATTAAGLAFKARLYERFSGFADCDEKEALWRSLRDDLLAQEPEAPAPLSGQPDAELLALAPEFEQRWASERALYANGGDSQERESAIEAAVAATGEIARQIRELPAITLQGYRLKASACAWHVDAYDTRWVPTGLCSGTDAAGALIDQLRGVREERSKLTPALLAAE